MPWCSALPHSLAHAHAQLVHVSEESAVAGIGITRQQGSCSVQWSADTFDEMMEQVALMLAGPSDQGSMLGWIMLGCRQVSDVNPEGFGCGNSSARIY